MNFDLFNEDIIPYIQYVGQLQRKPDKV